MSNLTTQPDPFSYDYQKHYVRSFVIGMPDYKLRRVAMYHFANSRTELAHRTAELVAGNDVIFDDFFRHFPLSWHESFGINSRILHYSVANGQLPKSERNSYAMKYILQK